MTDLWSRFSRWWHCVFNRHESVDGTVSFWCGTCGKEWVRSKYRK